MTLRRALVVRQQIARKDSQNVSAANGLTGFLSSVILKQLKNIDLEPW